jgi:hypothetical protein
MTLIITVSSNIVLELPPAAGMMAGLGLLPFFSFILPRHLTKIPYQFFFIWER